MEKLNKTFKINPLYEADGYKTAHGLMMNPTVIREYWTWIPRSLKHMHLSITRIMSAGQQLTIRYLHSVFQESFFDKPIEEAHKFTRDMAMYLTQEYEFDGFEKLHKLGYLPIRIKALPEGLLTNPNIPHMTGINTVDGYAWLGLFLETLISKLAWQLPTAATIGHQFKKNAVEWVTKTDGENLWLADFMCHDFHSRGGNPWTSIAVGLGHVMSNSGSDTLNVIPASRYYYDFDENNVPIYSVNASEHSVTCTGIFFYDKLLKEGKLNSAIAEYYAFDVSCEGSIEEPDYLAIAEWLNLRDWLKRFPAGILSVVSDTFNLWKLITFILPRLKKEIMARDGKLVIRPDSGNPVDIICGYVCEKIDDSYNKLEKNFRDYDFYDDTKIVVTNDNIYHNIRTGEKISEVESKGVIELLYEIFGGDKSKEGYIRLDPHIGAIYGDSINLEKQVEIYSRLADKGFASTNIVLGIGSYTYVMLTRDSAGWVAKGAWFETEEKMCAADNIAISDCNHDTFEDGTTCKSQNICSVGGATVGKNGITSVKTGFDIYKDPITDDGTKKSLKGRCAVHGYPDELYVVEECTEEEENTGLLQVIYEDGNFYNQTTLTEIRERLNKVG